MAIRIELEQETFNKPGRALIYDGDTLIKIIEATHEHKMDANGGWYDCVRLKEKSVPAALDFQI
ncbi:MAG: hypothetical protein Q8Q37_02720 [bacterium]|nr:hypothetical protein [bacterium]